MSARGAALLAARFAVAFGLLLLLGHLAIATGVPWVVAILGGWLLAWGVMAWVPRRRTSRGRAAHPPKP